MEAIQKKDYMGSLLDTFLDSSTEEQEMCIRDSLYTGILRLSEQVSQGQTYFQLGFTYEEAIYYGQQGEACLLYTSRCV